MQILADSVESGVLKSGISPKSLGFEDKGLNSTFLPRFFGSGIVF
ncbi:hypothetical protein F0726_02471 [Acidithiobacillus caldus]|nr:hypothetical protein F0726_02471 [Acidithiobacillus caldus]